MIRGPNCRGSHLCELYVPNTTIIEFARNVLLWHSLEFNVKDIPCRLRTR